MIEAKEVGILLVLILVVIPSVITVLFNIGSIVEGDTEALATTIEELVIPWWIEPLEWAQEQRNQFGTIMLFSLLALIMFIFYTTGHL